MKQKNIFFLTLSAVFIAIIAVMSFTPVGYLKIGIVEITLLVAPVVAGGILLGRWGGLLLGAAFGISSFLQCFGMSTFGATMLSINPVFTAIVCLLPRLALGFSVRFCRRFQIWSRGKATCDLPIEKCSLRHLQSC